MKLELVIARPSYWYFILNLRNKYREYFVSQQIISESEHANFMREHWLNYRICLANGQLAGFIGHANDDIRIAVNEYFRGCGIGKFMLKNFCEEYPYAQAKVKFSNKSSQRLFEACEFHKYKEDQEFIYYEQRKL